MKKFLVLLILLMMSAMPIYATDKIRVSPDVYQGIKKYKQGNYSGCIQSMQSALPKMKDPSIPYYYMGNSYVKLGRLDDARSMYEKVNELNTSSGLVRLSKYATLYLENIEDVGKTDEMREFIESKKFLHNDVVKELEVKEVEQAQKAINNSGTEDVDFKKYRYINDASQEMPTDEEIANAVKVLARVGYNPYAQNFNQDYMMMNNMFGNNNSNDNFANMIPYIMAQRSQNGNTQNNQDVSQQLMQTMMLRGMTSGF